MPTPMRSHNTLVSHFMQITFHAGNAVILKVRSCNHEVFELNALIRALERGQQSYTKAPLVMKLLVFRVTCARMNIFASVLPEQTICQLQKSRPTFFADEMMDSLIPCVPCHS